MPDVNLPLPFDAYAGEEPFVFVSYAHKDGHLVYPEIKALHDSGVRIWFDGGIDPGNEWPEDIAQALLKAKMFLVFVTPSAVESKNVRDEINFAINNDKSFLAVHLQETQLPAGLALRMGGIQAILKHRMTKENYNKKLLSTFPKVFFGEKKKTEPGPISPRPKGDQPPDKSPSFLKLKLFLILFFILALWAGHEVKRFMFHPDYDSNNFFGFSFFYIGACFFGWRYLMPNWSDLKKIIRTYGVKPTILFYVLLLLVLLLIVLFIGFMY